MVLIAAASAIGAGGGAVVGAATGTSDAVVYVDVERVAPQFAEWQWMLLIAVAIVLYVFAVLEFRVGPGRVDAGQKSDEAGT